MSAGVVWGRLTGYHSPIERAASGVKLQAIRNFSARRGPHSYCAYPGAIRFVPGRAQSPSKRRGALAKSRGKQFLMNELRIRLSLR